MKNILEFITGMLIIILAGVFMFSILRDIIFPLLGMIFKLL